LVWQAVHLGAVPLAFAASAFPVLAEAFSPEPLAAAGDEDSALSPDAFSVPPGAGLNEAAAEAPESMLTWLDGILSFRGVLSVL